jgi:phenylpropionate dioxygenase-like ring-hydroxylating dioxygenase large terminal subunit
LHEGRALALFRTGGGVAALSDRCPHRGAPLTDGVVVDGRIECPYHGWQFDATGRLTAMPCHVGELPGYGVPAWSTCEAGGLVFIARGKPEHSPYVHADSCIDPISVYLESQVRSTLADVAENILDATHTHFTHRLILRGLSAKRQRVRVTITGGEDWVEAVYQGETKQDGLVSRLLEGQRGRGVARYRAPGIAELEFWGPSRLNLMTTFHLREEKPGVVRGFAILTGPRQGGFGWLKAAILLPFFRIALGQDQRILEACTANRGAAGGRGVVAALDILRPHIDAIIAGRRPLAADRPLTAEMEL